MFDNIIKTNAFEPILIDKAQGSWFWDVTGKKYLDCTSGTWCVNLGHNHPKVTQALKDQLEKIIHRNMRFLTPITLEAAERLLKFMPNDYDKITFLNSGSEAVEYAINFARKATGRLKVLSLKDSYLGAYGIAKEASYTSSKASKLRIDYPRCFASNCKCLEEYSSLIDQIEKNYSTDLACFVFEPVMVSGGIHKPCTKFVEELCQVVQENGGLVVANEITAGMGRVGFRLGHEFYNIDPDVIAMGKAVGNGYPISAIVTKSSLEAAVPSADRYYAQSHQLDPLGAAAVNSVVKIFEEEHIIMKSQAKINRLNDVFQALSLDFIKEIRSFGMTFGIQIQPYGELSSQELIIKIKDELLKEGVMIGISLGKKLLRLLPPLTITDEDISFLQSKLIKVFDRIKSWSHN